jgi:hypothetical protein
VLEAFPFKDTGAYFETLERMGQYFVGTNQVEEGRRFRDRFLNKASYQKIASLPDSLELVHKLVSLEAWLAENSDSWRRTIVRHPNPSRQMVLNFQPVKVLTALAGSKEFASKERALFSRVAFTRTFARGETPDVILTDAMLSLNPAVAAVVEEVEAAYPSTQESHRWLLTVLRTPRLGILTTAAGAWEMIDLADESHSVTVTDAYDHNDKNWWCPLNLDRHLAALRDQFDSLTGNGVTRTLKERGSFYVSGRRYRSGDWFQAMIDPDTDTRLAAARERLFRSHPMIRSIDWQELDRLARIPSAPKLFANRAVAWARKGGAVKSGTAEALALAVRAARSGCRWAGSHKAYTQAAVGILQTKFKDTAWAKGTPYWYACLWHETAPRTGDRHPSCGPPQWPRQERPN